ATAGNGIFRSTDGGRSWKPTGPELDRTVVRCVSPDPSARETISVGTDGGVFLSIDGGKSWKRTSGGLPRAPVYALRLDPNDPRRFLAGTAAGLYESRDRAASWKPVPLPGGEVPITAIDFAPEGGLVLGTLGRGVVTLTRDAMPF